MVVLTVRNVKGALLWGILSATILSLILGVSKLPDGNTIVSLPPSIAPIAFKLDFQI